MSERDSKMIYTAADGKSKTLRVPKADPYQCEVDNMNDAILVGAPTLITLAESRRHVQVALALYESARTGHLVAAKHPSGARAAAGKLRRLFSFK